MRDSRANLHHAANSAGYTSRRSRLRAPPNHAPKDAFCPERWFGFVLSEITFVSARPHFLLAAEVAGLRRGVYLTVRI